MEPVGRGQIPRTPRLLSNSVRASLIICSESYSIGTEETMSDNYAKYDSTNEFSYLVITTYSWSRPIMKSYKFRLDIPSDKCLEYYRGTIQKLIVQLPDGFTIQIPTFLLKRFITSTGIQGEFVMTCDDDLGNATLRRSTE